MATNKYITISDYIPSSGSPSMSKKFMVVQGGYRPIKDKKQSIEETIQGGLDVSVGSIYTTHQYVIRVRAQEEDSQYGTDADLDYFYSLNNPSPASGSPGNILILTDHYGNERFAYFTGQYCPEPVTTILDGLYAWFMIPVEFRFLPVGQSGS